MVSIFKKYSLDNQSFSETIFHQDIKGRLSKAGLDSISEAMESIGANKTFLTKSLTPEQTRKINEVEAILLAQEAAIFHEGIQKVKIQDNREIMVNLEAHQERHRSPWTFSEAPFHPECGEWAGKNRLFWVRNGVAKALIALSEDLKAAGLGIHFEDAFRPLGVQEGLFRRRYQMTEHDHPNWSHNDILLETKSKTAYTPRLASHKAGAALDIRLRDLRTDKFVDIGHNYPDGGAQVALDSPFVIQHQWQNRMLLALVAKKHGFEMYPFEDWHISKGDNTAEAISNSSTGQSKYGPIKVFNLETGVIEEIYSSDELDQIFSEELV